MRFLASFSNPEDMHKLSEYLATSNIENKVEVETGTDWGSPNYGVSKYKIWIIDEDQVDRALEIFREFENDPSHPRYNLKTPPLFHLPKQKSSKRQQPLYRWTVYLVTLCSLVFVWTSLSTPEFKSKETEHSYSPIYTSPTKELMLYDFPKAYEILNELVTRYGVDALEDAKKLPDEARSLLRSFKNTPYWQGLYDKAVVYFSTGIMPPETPWFEKIQQGEIWRLFSPIFLHGDIFHLLFNMAWLYILGRQLELNLSPSRYLLFVFISAALTNTAQYLVSGPNFIGFSGVICAMLSFIWMRQIDAPWEGYQLQRSTFNFMMLFIFGMFALQSLAFLLEAFTGQTISTFIANTAHIAGLGCGWLFSKTQFFTTPKAS